MNIQYSKEIIKSLVFDWQNEIYVTKPISLSVASAYHQAGGEKVE